MRRLLLILLMLIMTTQWTWAAVASACQHESGQASRHIGHHEHKHEGAVGSLLELGDADSSQPDAKSLFVLDADCATCHVGVLALLAPGDALAPALMQDAALTPYRRSITHGVPERLIRPPHVQAS